MPTKSIPFIKQMQCYPIISNQYVKKMRDIMTLFG